MRPEEKFNPVNEHNQHELMECESGNWDRREETRFRRQSNYKKLQRIAILSLSLAFIFHYVYSEAFNLSLFGFTHPSVLVQVPVLHFSEPTAKRNLPFGLFVDDDKIWHIYFQCQSCTLRQHCAFGTTHSNSSSVGGTDRTGWGHATSSDLYTWSMQPIVAEEEGYDSCGGSAVIDENNTSGFFPNQRNGVIMVYTQIHQETKTIEQAIVYSTDGGHTFTKSAENHILLFSDGEPELRYPKVIWYEPTERWIMTVTKGNATTIGIYTFPNLIDWNAASEFTVGDLVDGGHSFEYSNLIAIPRLNSTGASNKNRPIVPGGTVKDHGDHLLMISSSSGSPLNGGSVTRYFPGRFNGTHFQPINHRTDRFIDFGPDNYASQFFFGFPAGSPVVSLGLAANLRETTSLPQTSILIGPRESYLIYGPSEGDLSYFSRPLSLDSLRGETIANFSASQQLADHAVPYHGSEAVLVEVRLDMQPPDDEVVELNLDFTFRSSRGPEDEYIMCTAVFRTWAADFGCARSRGIVKSSNDISPLDQMSIREVLPLLPFHNPAVRRWEVQAIMDRSILELYLNDGVAAGTITYNSKESFDLVHFHSRSIPDWVTLTVTVQELRPGQSVQEMV
ncbi:hypothetical protein LTR84_003432 [Exophiala bonariae]|uniref:Glycosyl hydrolase family 32 N-terminal domain-containing protein n=1 Tax=Exophiala bonariae TaxID=1690606 RepID=A0AAV9N728_9EURO|nr:hypothetical protein LTR84_003432 [Exophiala bonariae]